VSEPRTPEERDPETASPEPATEEDRAVAEAEITAAAERDRRHVTADASLTDRFVAAITSQSLLVTVLALVSAVIAGAIFIAVSDTGVQDALGYFTARPSDTFTAAWDAIWGAYSSIVVGAVGGVRPISETLTAATPLILTGLAVAVPFRAGLFNIGGEGQVLMGGTLAGLVGFSLTGLPMIVHLPAALIAGIVGGMAWGAIPGVLKARTGAHEVITTIMLNNIARFLLNYLLLTTLFQRPDRPDPISKSVADSALLPRFMGDANRAHLGFFVAVLAVVFVFWLVERSAIGFEVRAVGANPNAATTAGMSVTRMVVFTMLVAGALAGLAGSAQILGVQGRITGGFSAGVGFDGITVALLGRGGAFGTLAAGLLFGALRAGGLKMAADTGTSIDLIVVIQALVIVFIAAPALVRAIYRIKAEGVEADTVAKGWSA
jgi:general nucleoside transport system permease protein